LPRGFAASPRDVRGVSARCLVAGRAATDAGGRGRRLTGARTKVLLRGELTVVHLFLMRACFSLGASVRVAVLS